MAINLLNLFSTRQPALKVALCAAVVLASLACLHAPASAQQDGLSPLDLAIWSDPDFKRRFAESYMAETDIEPRVTADERDVIIEAQQLIEADDLPGALALLNESKTEASSAVYFFFIGNMHLQQGDLEPAAAEYAEAVDRFAKFRRAWRNLGICRFQLGEFEQARAAFSRVLELGGGDADTYGLLAFCFSSLENHLSAESAFRMANMLDPGELNWKMGLARSFFMQQRFADAAALAAQMIQDNPDNADLWLLQANAYIGLNKPQQAAENYLIVDGLGKSSVASLNTLGDIYTNEGLFDVATDAYIRAMTMAKQGSESDQASVLKRVLRAARVLSTRGATDQTKLLIEQVEASYADQLAVDDRKALLKLQARIAVAEGEADREIRVLEKIVELDPLDGEALLLLGQHSARAQEVEQAIFYYERAASLEDFEADAKVRHAQLLVSNGRYAEALPLLRSAQKIKFRDNIQKYLEQVERVSKAG